MTEDNKEHINTEKAIDIMSDIEFSNGTLIIDGKEIILEIPNNNCGTETVVKFISIREEPEITIRGDTALTTVSEIEMEYEGKEYSVDLEQPMSIVLNAEPFKQLEGES